MHENVYTKISFISYSIKEIIFNFVNQIMPLIHFSREIKLFCNLFNTDLLRSRIFIYVCSIYLCMYEVCM
jgi:hypothetical protein